MTRVGSLSSPRLAGLIKFRSGEYLKAETERVMTRKAQDQLK
jgi:hypothetical protein